MRIHSNGNVGIANNAPACTLDVSGTIQSSISSYSPSYPGAYLVTQYTTPLPPIITTVIQLPIFASIPDYTAFYNSYYPTGSTSGSVMLLNPNNVNGVTTSSTGTGSITYFATNLNVNNDASGNYYIINPGYKIIFYEDINFNYGTFQLGNTATISNLSKIPVTCVPSVSGTSCVELYKWTPDALPLPWVLIPAPTTASG
jgi:hypothetical protein